MANITETATTITRILMICVKSRSPFQVSVIRFLLVAQYPRRCHTAMQFIIIVLLSKINSHSDLDAGLKIVHTPGELCYPRPGGL